MDKFLAGLFGPRPTGKVPVMTSKLGAFFALVLDQVEADSVKALLPIIDKTATAIIANPSLANAVAQKTLFLGEVAAALPNLYSALAADLANDIKLDVDAFAASLKPSPVAPASA